MVKLLTAMVNLGRIGPIQQTTHRKSTSKTPG